MKAVLFSLWILSGGLLACTSPETCPSEAQETGIQVGSISDACRCEEASFDLGTGDAQFETVAEGEEVTMIYGPQGGWHIWGSVRVRNTRDVIKIHFTASDTVSQSYVVDVTTQVALAMEDDCTGTYTGMYGFLDTDPLIDGDRDTPPELLCYHELLLTMTLTDTAGRRLEQTRRVIAAPDQADADVCSP
ncbi:MAG: hypothetical protein VXW32_14675 [Myxococcota bacterium]|nr:hypothetical protein [Myxococcota bacterium]